MITDSELIEDAPLIVHRASTPSAAPVVLPENEGPSEGALAIMPRADVAKFKPLAALVADHMAGAKSLMISETDSPEEMVRKVAEAKRLREDIFRATRLHAGRLHKELKEGILEAGKRLDSEERQIRLACKEVEDHLERIEAAPAEFEKRRLDALRASRLAEISPFLRGGLAVDLAALTNEEWRVMLTDAKDLHALAKKRVEEAARKAEEQRQREEEERRAAAQAERDRQAKELAERTAELARVKAEADAKEAARIKELEDLKRQQAEERRRLDEERRAAEERSRLEFAELERQNREREAKEKAEREAREKQIAEERRKEREAAAAEREKLRKAQAEAEREKAAIAAEKARQEKEAADAAAAAAEAARRAAAAPDVEKLRAYSAALREVPVPELANRRVHTELSAGVMRMAMWVERQADLLEGGQPS